MDTNTDEGKMALDQNLLRHLNATWKWTMFLSVLGFILLGLLIIAGIVTNTFLSAFRTDEVSLGIPESLILILFLVITALYFLPVFYLFRFSRFSRDAIQNRDSVKMEKAFRNLRRYFTYIGIMAIIVISIYLLALAAGISTTSLLK